jgi:hypothetical protein
MYVPGLVASTRTVVLLDPFGFSNKLFKNGFAVGPAGTTDAVNVTLPAKLLRLVSVILVTPNEPGWKLSEVGEAEMEKSMTVIITDACELSEPLVPISVML